MKTKLWIACSLIAGAMSAHAESGFYVLGSVGQSHFNDGGLQRDTREFASEEGLALTSSKLDRSDTGYKLQLGYQFNDNFAIEGGYVDLGSLQYKGTLYGNDGFDRLDGTIKAKAEASGINLDAVLILPINSGFSLFGKLGVIDAKLKVKADARAVDTEISSGDSVAGSASDSESTTKIKAHIGLGVAYNFYQGFSVRVEAERFAKLGDSKKTGETDVDLYSVGLSYRF